MGFAAQKIFCKPHFARSRAVMLTAGMTGRHSHLRPETPDGGHAEATLRMLVRALARAVARADLATAHDSGPDRTAEETDI